MLQETETGRADAAEEWPHADAAVRPDEAPRVVAARGAPALPAAALSTLAAAALAACGGGGGGGGGGGLPLFPPAPGGTPPPGPDTPPAVRYRYPKAQSDAEAARFLLHAQFSASDAEIAAVRSKTYDAWLREQFEAPPSPSAWEWVDSRPYNSTDIDATVWRLLITAPDAMRQRLALALSEIFVVSANDIGSSWPTYMMAQYWDLLVRSVTGNFRQLLEDITLNPAMGHYLNTRGNQKEDNRGRQPDENYAREVMQLMSIGLHQLLPDGSTKTGADGLPQDSYTQDDVTQLARVFTGYDLDVRAGERNAFTPPGASYRVDTKHWTTRPMALIAARHSMLEARFLGTTVPAGTPGPAALKIALDTLFNHPNVGPFIGRQLIQRLVTSNPSPAYVQRVAGTFADNGAGVRGDMKSVFAAVLLDDEARGPEGLADPRFGRLREPMVRLVQWARSFGATSRNGEWDIGAPNSNSFGLNQSPLRSPSVFNFFRPGYVPPSTAIATDKLVAPEFQLVNESSVGGYLNYLQHVIVNGLANRDVTAAYTAEKALVLDAPALLRRLNLLLAANQLSEASVQRMAAALATPALNTGSNDAAKANRLHAAVLMTMGGPEYLIQK